MPVDVSVSGNGVECQITLRELCISGRYQVGEAFVFFLGSFRPEIRAMAQTRHRQCGPQVSRVLLTAALHPMFSSTWT